MIGHSGSPPDKSVRTFRATIVVDPHKLLGSSPSKAKGVLWRNIKKSLKKQRIIRSQQQHIKKLIETQRKRKRGFSPVHERGFTKSANKPPK